MKLLNTLPSAYRKDAYLVLRAAQGEDLYSDGNRWWDEERQVRLAAGAVSWCRGAELVERAPDHPMRPWRIFRLTSAGRAALTEHRED